MHKLRRMHIANAGYELAFFEGETWRFYDGESGDPVDTVLYAANGCGKTTSLALLFSVIDTSQNRFLRRLSHSHESFDQYFNDEPALIALEWDRGTDEKGRPLSPFVTAQIVTKKWEGIQKKTDRVFIAFRADRRFGFESLPFAGLGRRYETRLKTRDEVSRWVTESIRSFQESHYFFRTDNQADWQKHLEEAGIDVVLLSKQVDLNRHEGGLDEFLKFPNEKSFVDRFFSLTINEDRARLVREDLREGISKLSGYDVLKERLGVMRSLEDAHSAFRATASKYQARLTELKNAQAEAVGLRHALENRVVALSSRIEALKKEETSTVDKINSDKGQLVERANEQAACDVETKRRDMEFAATQHEEAERTGELVKKELDSLKAAQAWRPVARLDGEIDELRKTLESEHKSLEIPRRAAETVGSELAAALEWHIELNQERASALDSQVAKNNKLEREQKKTIQNVEYEIQDAQKRLGGVDEWLKNFQGEKRNLIRRGDLRDDELALTGLMRCDAEITKIKEELQSLKDRLLAIRQEQRSLSDSHADLQAQRGHKEGELKAIQVRINEGQDRMRSLSSDPFILRVCKEDSIDLESPAVQRLLSEYSDLASHRILESQRLISIKKLDAESIKRYGLAAIDDNTEAVVAFLGSKGIRDAIPFPSWLAKLDRSPEDLRKFMISDPARFTGVAVQGREAFEKARDLTLEKLELTRPVVVSLATDEPSAFSTMSFVVPVNRDEAYDFKAAQKCSENIEHEIDHLSAAISQATQDFNDSQRALTNISNYVDAWGRGQLDALRLQHSGFKRELEQLFIEIGAVKNSLDVIRTEQAEKEERRTNLDMSSNVLTATRERLNDFRQRWEDKSESKREERNRIKAGLQDLDGKLSSLKSTLEIIFQDIERSKKACEENNQRIKTLKNDRIKLEHIGPSVVCSDPERLDELLTRYKQCVDIYTSAMQERFGVLQGERNAKIQSRNDRLEEFNKTHQSCDINDVRKLARMHNLDDVTAEGEQKYLAIISEVAEKKSEKKLSKKAFDIAFRALSDDARSLLPSLEKASKAALVTLAEKARDERDRLTIEIPASERHLSALKELLGDAQAKEKVCRSYISTLQVIHSERIMDVSLETEENLIETQIVGILDRVRHTSNAADKSKSEAFSAWEIVKTRVDQENFRRLESRIAGDLRYNSIDNAIGSAAEHGNIIRQHIASIEDDIKSKEENISILRQRLSSLLTESLRLLRKACELGSIPTNVPRLGGQQVLRMNRAIIHSSQDYRDQSIKAYLEKLVRDDRVPATGHELAGELVDNLRERMGLEELAVKILKPTDTGPMTYFEIHRMSSSGGEGLTAALLLYLVLSRIRAENLAETRRTLGGVLIADNPFGKATHSLFLKSQRALASAMRIQLIFTSQVKDFDALGEFPHIIKYAKREERPALRQTLVRLAHETTGEPPDVVVPPSEALPGVELET